MPTGWPLAFVLGLPILTVEPGAPDMDLLIGKIQILPLKAKALADAKPGRRGQQRQRTLQRREAFHEPKSLRRCDDDRLVVAGCLAPKLCRSARAEF